MEIFKDVPGYEKIYQVSNFGRVKSLQRKVKHSSGGDMILKERIIRTPKNHEGYRLLNLRKNNKSKCFRVHQLVAMAFLGHEPNGFELVVDHIDNDPTNNNIENLQIVTNRQNCSKDKPKSSSKFIGVYWNKKDKKFMSRIRINGRIKYLGSFNCETKAHLTYQLELEKI